MRSERHAIGQSRSVWPPSPGFFRVKLAARAWAVPCQIVRHDDGTWQAVVDGREQTPHADPAYAPEVATIWTSGQIITENEYRFLNTLREHYAQHGPADHPCLHPRTPINPMRLRPIHPPRRTPTR